MDSYRTLVTRAQAEFDAGNFERCQTTINAAKALKRQQNSRGGIDLHPKRMLDELGAVGDYDPAYANRDIAGLPASAGGNSWPGQKNFVAPPTISLSEKDAEASTPSPRPAKRCASTSRPAQTPQPGQSSASHRQPCHTACNRCRWHGSPAGSWI
jgi:hypothetical protein